MVKKTSISRKEERAKAQSAPVRSRGQPRKSYPNGLVSADTCAEIDAILRSETRGNIRKRLIAVRTIYAGGTDAAAAQEAGASIGGVSLWLRQAENEGIASLLHSASGKKPTYRFSKRRAARLRAAITAALGCTRGAAVRNRLNVVRSVLEGQAYASAARDGGVTAAAVSVWMRNLHRGGVEALRSDECVPLVQADPAMLRSQAAIERDGRFALRLFAIALLAEGRSCQQAADRVGVSFVRVHAWLNCFRADGIEGLRHLPRAGGPKLKCPGLTPRQRADLAAVVRANPYVPSQHLQHVVKTRFGFDCTLAALDRIVREDLGFVRRNGALVPSKGVPA